MSPQGLIVQENLETDTVVPASVKTPSSVKETKSVKTSPKKKIRFRQGSASDS